MDTSDINDEENTTLGQRQEIEEEEVIVSDALVQNTRKVMM